MQLREAEVRAVCHSEGVGGRLLEPSQLIEVTCWVALRPWKPLAVVDDVVHMITTRLQKIVQPFALHVLIAAIWVITRLPATSETIPAFSAVNDNRAVDVVSHDELKS